MEGPFNSQIHVCRDASRFERPRRSIRFHGHFFPERHELSGLHPQRVERRKSYRRQHGRVPRACRAYGTIPYDSTLITRSRVSLWRRTVLLMTQLEDLLLCIWKYALIVPLLMSPVRQATGWLIEHIWVRLLVDEYSKKAVQIHW